MIKNRRAWCCISAAGLLILLACCAALPGLANEAITGLSSYFPTNKLALPEGSTVIQVFEADIDSYTWEKPKHGCIEITEVHLPLTMTEAVEYFTERLNRGGATTISMEEENFFFLPDGISDAYPDVTYYTSI